MISVIIPTCDRNELLSNCLDKLEYSVQSAQADLYEVIVTDDSKESLAKNIIETKYSWARWVKGPAKGPAANRNNGAKYAHGEWLTFIDDDCLPDNNLINAYKKAIVENHTTKVFEGYINTDREQRNFLEESPINTTGGYLWSCNFMIKKDLFNNVLKGFDEGYPFASMEDVDLNYRILQLNEPTQFLPDARVIHPWRIQQKPFEIGSKRFSSLQYFLNKFPEKKKDYNSIYFLRAFLRTGYDLFKNSFHYHFRGFTKRIGATFLQLYFAFKVKQNK